MDYSHRGSAYGEWLLVPPNDRAWAVGMFKDEEDVAYHVLMHMAEEGMNGILVADNLSTDGTRQELERAKQDLRSTCSVIIVDDNDPAYFQSRKMTVLAEHAASQGADWIIPFDADEIWYVRGDRIAVELRKVSKNIGVVSASLYNHFSTSIDTMSPNPFQSLVWRQKDPGELPKVCFRWNPDVVVGQGNHRVENGGKMTSIGLEIRHFPYRSLDHFIRKARNGAAAYAATDLPDAEGAHWRSYGQLLERHGEEALREVYEKWFHFLSPVDEGMVLDPAPFRRWTKA